MKQLYAQFNSNDVRNLISLIVTFNLKDLVANKLDRKKIPKESKLKIVKIAKLFESLAISYYYQ